MGDGHESIAQRLSLRFSLISCNGGTGCIGLGRTRRLRRPIYTPIAKSERGTWSKIPSGVVDALLQRHQRDESDRRGPQVSGADAEKERGGADEMGPLVSG
jgi:hypothetical protein